jgi:hypothetical protein
LVKLCEEMGVQLVHSIAYYLLAPKMNQSLGFIL